MQAQQIFTRRQRVGISYPPTINTPDEAIAEVKAGNLRNVDRQLKNTNLKEMIAFTIDELIKSGKLKMIGANYDVTSDKIL